MGGARGRMTRDVPLMYSLDRNTEFAREEFNNGRKHLIESTYGRYRTGHARTRPYRGTRTDVYHRPS